MTDHKVLSLINGEVEEAIISVPQEFFIGTPPMTPPNPALIFSERTIGGQVVYEMKVSDGNI